MVRDNITLSRADNPTRFENAVTNAKVNVDFDREIVDGGISISSDEQRRIEIARSLFALVSILIFDEVVSTLDIEIACEIEKMILDYSDKTVIFVFHNFSGKLIKEYDEILVMDSGKLLAHGTYDKLYRDCAYFKRICDIKLGICAIKTYRGTSVASCHGATHRAKWLDEEDFPFPITEDTCFKFSPTLKNELILTG